MRSIFVLWMFTGAIVVVAQATLLSERELDAFLPVSVKGYNQSGQSKGKVMKIGTLRYSLAQRTFTKGDTKIKILLFDYVEAPVMYKQATQKFETFTQQHTDSLVLKPLELSNGVGWEKYSSHNTSTQIFTGINNRFYLTLEGQNVSMSELKLMLERIPLSSFPR
jgi:hypothetical protein